MITVFAGHCGKQKNIIIMTLHLVNAIIIPNFKTSDYKLQVEFFGIWSVVHACYFFAMFSNVLD